MKLQTANWLKKPLFWLISGLILVWLAIFRLPDNQLHLVFCDVGQGDAILVTYQNQQILIDGGPDNQVLNCLSQHLPYWDRQLEAVIETHPETDHLTGLIEVIQRYQINYLILSSVAKNSDSFKSFQQAVENEGAQLYFPAAGDSVNFGPLEFAFLWPSIQNQVLGATTLENELNDTSLVAKLSFGSFDVLLPGDISSRIENNLAVSSVEVLKVAHHGSKFSTSEQFLEKIKPQLAVISVGKNSYGHPTSQVLEELKQAGVKILRTDTDGEVEIVSDGKSWRVENEI